MASVRLGDHVLPFAKKETEILRGWLNDGVFDSEGRCFGFELEGCLLGKDQYPSLSNQEFLKTANHEQVVSELAKFNFGSFSSSGITSAPDAIAFVVSLVSTGIGFVNVVFAFLNLPFLSFSFSLRH